MQTEKRSVELESSGAITVTQHPKGDDDTRELSQETWVGLAEVIAKIAGPYIAQGVSALEAKIPELEARIAALEAKFGIQEGN